ncbi:MAG TPA: c-type cytochrome [Burkholderiales bacterium]|nr:c-type cytochrome [Burkholderiales bacterium]
MKLVITLLAAAAAVSLAAPTHAADAAAAEALAKASGCLACHTVDKKLVGPSYREIANRYRQDKGAAAKLAQKVKTGGKGVWGDIPMPPNGHVKGADIQNIVQWILTVK